MGAPRFITYGSVSDGELSVEWLETELVAAESFDLIVAAGYEPDDPTVKIGTLNVSWGGHESGCLVVCYGSLSVSQRFAVSEKPVAWADGSRSQDVI